MCYIPSHPLKTQLITSKQTTKEQTLITAFNMITNYESNDLITPKRLSDSDVVSIVCR